TATGVAASRPCSSRVAAIAGAFSTAIISTTVPRSLATPSQTTSDSGCPGGRCPEITVNSWVTPRWVTGIPAMPGTAIGLLIPGITVTGTPAARQAMISSQPRPRAKVAMPLYPGNPFPGQRPIDDDPVDLLLLRRPTTRQLGHVDQLDVGTQVAEQLTRSQS